ncbi:hypothetical protein H4Q26_004401 [Puccinia striiformis f. sp. tritici PST-130]|nr:hypothetical protein H4Q26_004401 [Puccinia striiformis f. sp. tritici PST-130]
MIRVREATIKAKRIGKIWRSPLESTHAVRYYIAGRKVLSISLGQVLDSVGDGLDGFRLSGFMNLDHEANTVLGSPIRRAEIFVSLRTVQRIPLHRGGNQAQASYIISGSFKSSSLYVLRYDRENKKLEVVQSVPGHGPHQYLYVDRPNHRLYVTSWKEPPHLSAWSIQVDHPGGVHPRLSLINQAPITAVSSYITSKHGLLFSAGGPTGEIHQLNQDTGAIERSFKSYCLIWVCGQRNGSHAIEISSLDEWSQLDMGIQPEFSKRSLEFSSEVNVFNPVMDLAIQSSVRTGEGSSRVDLYHVTPSGIVHQASSSVIGEPLEHSKYRGDTVRILPSSFLYSSTDHEYIFATTRGIDYSQHGQ